MKRVCSWCGRAIDDRNDGLTLELTPGVNDTAHEMGLDPDDGPVTHGICNACARGELASVGIPEARVAEIIAHWRRIG